MTHLVHHIPVSCLSFIQHILLNLKNIMNTKDLLSKYKHQLILKNYSSNTVNAYLNGLKLFLGFIKAKKLKEVGEKELENYFYHCNQNLG
jgi:site-specific recombinase XerD